MNKGQNIKNWTMAASAAILILTGNLSAQPQRRQGPPPLPDSTQIVKMIDEMTEKLSLEQEQKSEIFKLHFSHFAEAKKLTAEHKAEHEKHRETMNTLKSR